MDYEKSVNNASEALLACIENAGNFLASASILIENERYRDALLLTMYAGEEIGKVILVFNYPRHCESTKKLLKWKKRFFDHTEKFWFLRSIEKMENGYFSTKVRKKADRKTKNNRIEISYINYRDNRFVFPRVITKEEAIDYFDRINEKYKNMRKYHPTKDIVEKQLQKLRELPKDHNKLIETLKENGFKELNN